ATACRGARRMRRTMPRHSLVEPRLPSWWLEEALAAEGQPEPAPALEGDAEADVAIVGGGYTGLWTALALRERLPDARVVVLEAGICGAGPSGRNGGFLNGWWPVLGDLRRLVGDEAALEIARTGARIVPAVREFCERHGEDVWLRAGGELKVSAAPAQDRVVAEAAEAARALGVEKEAVPLSRQEVAQRCRSPVFRGGVFFRDGANVQPALLVRALRRAVLAEGVGLHEGSPVVAVEDGAVRTPRGRLRAPEIVLATNAA